MKKNNQKYRQGDVLLVRVDGIPSGAVKQKCDRVILAHGEATGHHHSFCASDAALLVAGADQFVRVAGRRIEARAAIVRRWRGQVMVNLDGIGMVEFADADVAIDGEEAVISGEFGLLEHQEHTFHGIPAGKYRNIRQMEYSPAAIRNVAD